MDFDYLVKFARAQSLKWVDQQFDRFSQNSNTQRLTECARPQRSIAKPRHNLHFDDNDNEQGNQSGGSGLSGLAIGTGIGKKASKIQFCV